MSSMSAHLGKYILHAMVCNVAAVVYKAAVVELPADWNADYPLRKELTANATVALAQEAALAGAHIIVFPEYGLIGFPNRPYVSTKKKAFAALFDEIPEPSNDVPCLNPSRYARAPTIVTLSCGARNSGIAIVGCMGDIVRCPNAAYPGCSQQSANSECVDVPGFIDAWGGRSTDPSWGGTCSEWAPYDCSQAVEQFLYTQEQEDDVLANCPASCGACEADGYLQFNTAVAFDTDGRFLLKYHKTNFWGEDAYLDAPKGCEQKTFSTSFGVEFGIVICADVFYEFPAERLVRGGGKNFVTPVAWGRYMAHMQAMSWYQGWSLRNCVNIAFANLPWNNPGGDISSGSGIMSCGRVKASYYKNPPFDTSGYIGPIIYGELDSEVPEQAPSTLAPSPLSSSHVGQPGWQFAALASGKVCSDTLCCFASSLVGDRTGYAIGALSGRDSGCGNYAHGHDCGATSLHWPAQVCGVFACAEPTAACLDYQTPTGGLTGVRLEMVVSPTTAVYPHVVAFGGSGTTDEQLLLEPGVGFDFLHNGTRVILSVDSSPHPITSAEVYGRRYQQDTLLYSCPASPASTSSGVGTRSADASTSSATVTTTALEVTSASRTTSNAVAANGEELSSARSMVPAIASLAMAVRLVL